MKIVFLYIFTSFFIMNLFSLDDEINELTLPELGDRVSGAVSSSEEKAIGEMFLKQVYSQAPLITDPLLFEYTEHLIYRLSEYSQVNDRYFTILLIDDDSLNAFAAPGGIIGINGGLFLYSDNDVSYTHLTLPTNREV